MHNIRNIFKNLERSQYSYIGLGDFFFRGLTFDFLSSVNFLYKKEGNILYSIVENSKSVKITKNVIDL